MKSIYRRNMGSAMSKYLILGNGTLGTELKKQTGWKSVTRSDDGFDVLDSFLYGRYLKGYECIINCTGFTKDHSDKGNNLDANFKAVVELANYCARHNKKYVHISTDIVYAGSVHSASESDVPVHARNWYAYSKLLADGYVQVACENYLLIRTAFKPRPFPHKVAFPKVGNFDFVDVITGLIVELINGGAVGVYNVGTEYKTMYSLAQEIVPDIVLDDSRELVDVSMNLEKLREFRTDEAVASV
jgi:dTDP-4-dehydrorhamnose reductase